MKTTQWILHAGQKDTGGCVPLKWVSPEGERTPQPRKTTFPLLTGFNAGGKYYPRLSMLTTTEVQAGLCRDVYGREVICLKERFPCFDSYDYLYEDRYFRWFLLRCDGKLTMVYFADQGKTVEVTEDADKLKHWQWEEICEIWNQD